MIAGIKEFFTQFIEPEIQRGGAASDHALQVATAALMFEMMRMDDQLTEVEKRSITDTLRQQFGLDSLHLERLMVLAEQEAQQATDYFQFTSLINKTCDAAQKIRIIENLWRVAMIDGYLDANELHLVGRVGNLLHIGHADYVGAKQRAREATGLLLK